MRLLLDTHSFLWAALSPELLSDAARTAILDPSNDIFVSAISYWEISLKYGLGKLELEGITPEDLSEATTQLGFGPMDLDPSDAASFWRLPKTGHGDPFDRMLVWQAIQGDCTLVSRDGGLAAYERDGLKLLR